MKYRILINIEADNEEEAMEVIQDKINAGEFPEIGVIMENED